MYLASFVSPSVNKLKIGEWTEVGERREFVVLAIFEGKDLIVARCWDGVDEFWALFDAKWAEIVEEMGTVAADIVKGVKVDSSGLGSGYDWAKFEALVRASKWTLRGVEPVFYVDRIVVTGLGGTADVDEEIFVPWQKQAANRYFDNFAMDFRLKGTKSGGLHEPLANNLKPKLQSFIYEEDDNKVKPTAKTHTSNDSHVKSSSSEEVLDTIQPKEARSQNTAQFQHDIRSPMTIDHPLSRTVVYNDNQVRMTSRKRRRGISSSNG